MQLSDSKRPSVRSITGCRQILGYFIAIAFLLGGLVIGIAGVEFALRHDNRDDLLFALILGGMLVLIGVLIIWALRRRAKSARVDANTVTAVGMAHLLNQDPSDTSDWGDGGDGGDGGGE